MKSILVFLALTCGMTIAQSADLTLARDGNWPVIRGTHLRQGGNRIEYRAVT